MGKEQAALHPIARTAINLAMPPLRWISRQDRLCELLTPALRPYNPFDPRHYSDPYTLFREVADHGPVVYHRLAGMWIVSGYDEAAAVLRAPSTVDRSRIMNSVKPYADLDEASRLLLSLTLGMLDPPEHTRLRRILGSFFTVAKVKELEPEIRRNVQALLDDGDQDRRFDIADRLNARLPIAVIGALIGLPSSAWQSFSEWSNELTKLFDPFTGFDPKAFDAAVNSARSVVEEALARAEASPADDLVSLLAQARRDGQVTTEEAIASCIVVGAAGYETTFIGLGNAMVALAEHPEQRRMLVEQPDLMENAVEELLRHSSPFLTTDRTMSEDLEINGTTIPAGSFVLLLLAAANRDPRRFDRPNEFLVDRQNPQPLSFALGIHYCLGAALARMEFRVALQEFLHRYPDYTVVHTEWKRSTFLRGPTRLVIDPGGP